MAANLGSSVAMVNCLGDDSYGKMYRERFDALGIDTTHVFNAPGSSGVAPIWVEANGTNRIIIVPGANDSLTPHQAAAAVEALPATLVIGELEIPQAVTAAAFSAARRRGATTVLNPAPAATLDASLLAASDWLIPNESEFALLATGALADTPPSDEAILRYASTVSARLIVTLGAAGVALVADGGVHRLPAPALHSKVIDTTGAGDAFVGAFCHGLASGLGEREAVQLGMTCASDSVTREGSQTSFPSRDACKALLA